MHTTTELPPPQAMHQQHHVSAKSADEVRECGRAAGLELGGLEWPFKDCRAALVAGWRILPWACGSYRAGLLACRPLVA